MIPRFAKLMARLIESGEFTAEGLAKELGVPPSTIGNYLAGETLMPLSRQLVLAKLTVERSKANRSAGSALLAQVTAATAFHSKKTATHAEPPTTWGRRRR